MSCRLLVLFCVSGVVALTAGLVDSPPSAQADGIPQKYKGTVASGLEYLVKQQHKDGHWEGEDGKYPVAMTALAGLALLMEGQREFIEGRGAGVHKYKYLRQVRKAADWLIQRSEARKDGLIFSGHASETASYMEGHALATLFLAGVYIPLSDDYPPSVKKLHQVLNRAVDYTNKAKSTLGGWYHTSTAEGHDLADVFATNLQLQALTAVVYRDVPRKSELADGKEYLRMALNGKEARKVRTVEKAGAMLSRLRGQRGALDDKDEYWLKWFKECQAELAVGNKIVPGDELTHYYYAQALSRVGGDGWENYRTATFDHLLSIQNKDGSWPAGPEQPGVGAGPVYATAVWCIVLQYDNKSHPAMLWPQEFMDVS